MPEVLLATRMLNGSTPTLRYCATPDTGCRPRHSATGTTVRCPSAFDIVVAHLHLGGGSGIGVLRICRAHYPIRQS